jgi:hypothetical protein
MSRRPLARLAAAERGFTALPFVVVAVLVIVWIVLSWRPEEPEFVYGLF